MLSDTTMPLSGNSLRQVVHTHVPLSPSSINWYEWEGRRRSGVAVAMLSGLTTYRLKTGHSASRYVTMFKHLAFITYTNPAFGVFVWVILLRQTKISLADLRLIMSIKQASNNH